MDFQLSCRSLFAMLFKSDLVNVTGSLPCQCCCPLSSALIGKALLGLEEHVTSLFRCLSPDPIFFAYLQYSYVFSTVFAELFILNDPKKGFKDGVPFIVVQRLNSSVKC